MSSVAVRNTAARAQMASHTASTRRRVRVSHKPRTKRRRNALAAIIVVFLVSVFGYVTLHASLTAASFDLSRMNNEFKAEKVRNERLRIEYVRRVSPAFAMDAARKCGMVYASEYDYLSKSSTVARADQDR